MFPVVFVVGLSIIFKAVNNSSQHVFARHCCFVVSFVYIHVLSDEAPCGVFFLALAWLGNARAVPAIGAVVTTSVLSAMAAN